MESALTISDARDTPGRSGPAVADVPHDLSMTEPTKTYLRSDPRSSKWSVFKGWHHQEKTWREFYTRMVGGLLAVFVSYVVALLSDSAPIRPLKVVLLLLFIPSVYALFSLTVELFRLKPPTLNKGLPVNSTRLSSELVYVGFFGTTILTGPMLWASYVGIPVREDLLPGWVTYPLLTIGLGLPVAGRLYRRRLRRLRPAGETELSQTASPTSSGDPGSENHS